MLIKDVIKANEALKDLSDAQVIAIETLSKNDEKGVIDKEIAAKTKALHSGYDKDIKDVLGLEKPAEKTTYKWLKEDILPQVKTAEKSKGELEAKDKKIADLNLVIKEGKGDEAIKQQLKDSETKITMMSDLHKEELGKANKETESAQKDLFESKVESQFTNGLSKVTFKSDKLVSPAIRDMVITAAKTSLLEKYTPKMVQIGNSDKKTLVFHDDNGAVVLNKENKLEAYTAGELLLAEKGMQDILDKGKKATGTGEQGNQGNQGAAATNVDVSEAKSQVEADRILDNQILKEGINRGTDEFAERKTELKKDLDLKDLPMGN